MKSARLLGKVLLPILDKPVIYRIFERLKFSKEIDEICISTSTDPSNDPIEMFAQENDIKIHRGSEQNLISRHLGAAKQFGADAIVRITSDDPLIDPEITDNVIRLFKNDKTIDFASNNKIKTFPIGLDVEVMKTKTLETLFPISENEMFYKYFIGKYIYEHPQQFKSASLELKVPKLLRWTMDYEEDYEFMKKIFALLYKKGEMFYMRDIIQLLGKNPELIKINSMHNFQHVDIKKKT